MSGTVLRVNPGRLARLRFGVLAPQRRCPALAVPTIDDWRDERDAADYGCGLDDDALVAVAGVSASALVARCRAGEML